jgi:hypothetical protein
LFENKLPNLAIFQIVIKLPHLAKTANCRNKTAKIKEGQKNFNFGAVKDKLFLE